MLRLILSLVMVSSPVMGEVSVVIQGTRNGHQARVDNAGNLKTAQAGPVMPDLHSRSPLQYFTATLSSSGASSSGLNQNVNGSSTEVTYFLQAHMDYDIRVMGIVIILADSAVAHNNFGNVSALTNGWDLQVVEGGVTTKIIDEAKTGGQLIAQAGFGGAYGDGATSFELTNWTGNEDAQTVVIPIHDYVPNGIRLGRRSTNRIESVVKDDLTGLTEFTVRIIGYKQFPMMDGADQPE